MGQSHHPIYKPTLGLVPQKGGVGTNKSLCLTGLCPEVLIHLLTQAIQYLRQLQTGEAHSELGRIFLHKVLLVSTLLGAPLSTQLVSLTGCTQGGVPRE